MSFDSWFIYLGLVFIATATPGPAVVFIISNSLLYGWQKAIFAAIGNISGLLILGIVAISGLGVVIQTSQYLFSIIKYAGALYLVYLGIKLIVQKKFNLKIDKDKRAKPISKTKIFLQAFGVAISNPKAIVFLTALFPQFINLEKDLLIQFSELISILIFSSFTFLTLYALLAHSIKDWLLKRDKIKTANRINGAVFITLGALMASSSNQ